MNYTHEFDGGLDNYEILEPQSRPPTRQEICPLPECSLEEYVVSFPAMLDRTTGPLERKSIRINAVLYYILKKLNIDADYNNITMYTTAIISKGMQTFRTDYVSDDDLKTLQKSSLNNDIINGMVSNDWGSQRKFENQYEVAHVFKSVLAKNWNVDMKSKTGHYYETSNIANAFSNMTVFGFDGRDGTKALREFIIMLGLRSSIVVQLELEPTYNKIVTVTDTTLKVFDTLFERENMHGRGEGW
jgi:hypothetical protein